MHTSTAVYCFVFQIPSITWWLKPWKWGAAGRYYTSHTKAMLPTRKSVPRSSCQSDHTKTCSPSERDTNLSCIDMSPVHVSCSVWSCFPFIRSGQNHLARHSERGKKTRQTEEEVWRQHQRMDRPGVHQVPEGSGKQRKMEKTGCEVICGPPTTLEIKG